MFFINIFTFFYFDFLHEQVKILVQLQAFSSDSLTANE